MWRVLAVLIVLGGCGDDEPLEAKDGQVGRLDGGMRDQGRPADGEVVFESLVQQACTKLIAQCADKLDPLGRRWNESISPWSEQTCQAQAACMAEKTASMCYSRLATYYLCVAHSDPIDCAGCLEQFQFVQGACPCLQECNPSCV